MSDIKITKFAEVFLLSFILLLGVFLNFYKLNNTPSGLYVDEAVTGYNAYSILTTGRDEYGKPFPVAFRFLGSYSPPLYTYLTVPIIPVFGVIPFSVRFISAIAGVLGILIVFTFLKNLGITHSKATPLVGATLFAISPWSIFFSRAGYEINLGFLIFAAGALFLWLGIKKPILRIPGFLLLSLSTYGAHTERFLAPMVAVFLLLIFQDKLLRQNVKHTIAGILLAVLIQIPHLAIITTPALNTKSGLFYSGVIDTQAEKISHFLPVTIAIPLAFLREFFSQYILYFSPRSLFFLPDPDPQRSLPELSVFYPWMVIPYFLGLYMLWEKRKTPAGRFIFLLLLLIPLPVALTADPFSTQRALPLLLPFVLVISLGMDQFFRMIKPKILLSTFAFLLFWSLLLLWRSYFIFLPQERASAWGYGLEQLAQEIKKRPTENFVIDQTRSKPVHAGLAFFLQYPPAKFQTSVNPDIKDNYYTNIDFDSYYKFANIETRNINWEKDIYKEQVLVGDSLSISESQKKEHALTQLFEIRDPLNKVVFQGVRTNSREKCASVQYKDPRCVTTIP